MLQKIYNKEKKHLLILFISLKGFQTYNAMKEFELSCERLFYYASMADKFEGNIHNPPMSGLTLQ